MKRVKNLTVVLVVIGLFALSVIGCNRSGAMGQAPAASAGSSEASAAAAVTIKPDAIKLRLSTIWAEGQPLNTALLEFVKNVETRTNGGIDVETYFNSVLGPELDVLDTVIAGGIEMGAFGSSFYDRYAGAEYADAPFILDGWDHYLKLLDSGIIEDVWKDFPQKVGLRYLATLPVGFRQVMTVKPIKSMNDFVGTRIRVPNNPTVVNTIRSFGASPVTMAFGEAFPAVEAKVVEGVELPWTDLDANRWYEIAKYIFVTNHLFSVYGLDINEKFYQSLSPEYQKIITDAAKECEELATKLIIEAEAREIQHISDNGVEITRPDDALRAQVLAAQQENINNFLQENPASKPFYDRIKALVK